MSSCAASASVATAQLERHEDPGNPRGDCDVIYCKGNRGKSKVEVRLSIDTCMEQVILFVWEKGKITHTFRPDRMMLEAMANEAGLALQRLKAREQL